MPGNLNETIGFSTLFGREAYRGNVATLVKVIGNERMPNTIAAIKFADELKSKDKIVRQREYVPPQDVDTLDAMFSDAETGSELYRKAKSLLFDVNAPKPNSARKVKLRDGREAVVHDYRTWLSHWLIRGLANLSKNEERLRKAGIVSGEDLEAKLAHRNGIDFSGAQYTFMTSVIQELVNSAYTNLKEPKRKEGALHNYLTGETITPLLGDWELLHVFGSISKKIQIAASSKNREQFESQDGFYWAARLWNLWRSAFRKNHAISFDIKSGKAKDGNWDYMPIGEIYRQLAKGIVERIDDRFDWVTIGNVSREGSWSTYFAKKCSGMLICNLKDAIALPQNVVALTPKQLWLHYDAIVEVLQSLMGEYLRKKWQYIVPNEAGLVLNPAASAIDALLPKHKEMAVSYKVRDISKTNKIPGFSEEQVKKVRELRTMLIEAVSDGSFDYEFGLQSGTVNYMLSVMYTLSRHTPEEYVQFQERAVKIKNIGDALSNGRPNTNKVGENRALIDSIGINGNNNRELRRLKDSMEKKNKRYQRQYWQIYGESPHIDISLAKQNPPGFYQCILSIYGLDCLHKYAHLALEGINPIIRKGTVSSAAVFGADSRIVLARLR